MDKYSHYLYLEMVWLLEIQTQSKLTQEQLLNQQAMNKRKHSARMTKRLPK